MLRMLLLVRLLVELLTLKPDVTGSSYPRSPRDAPDKPVGTTPPIRDSGSWEHSCINLDTRPIT